jgi:hypothetical protein
LCSRVLLEELVAKIGEKGRQFTHTVRDIQRSERKKRRPHGSERPPAFEVRGNNPVVLGRADRSRPGSQSSRVRACTQLQMHASQQIFFGSCCGSKRVDHQSIEFGSGLTGIRSTCRDVMEGKERLGRSRIDPSHTVSMPRAHMPVDQTVRRQNAAICGTSAMPTSRFRIPVVLLDP